MRGISHDPLMPNACDRICTTAHLQHSQRMRCRYEVHYAESSGISGNIVSDRIALSANTSAPVVFGCQSSESGAIFDQKPDGILGLADAPMSLVSQLASLEATAPEFSLCYASTSYGGATLQLRLLPGAHPLPVLCGRVNAILEQAPIVPSCFGHTRNLCAKSAAMRLQLQLFGDAAQHTIAGCLILGELPSKPSATNTAVTVPRARVSNGNMYYNVQLAGVALGTHALHFDPSAFEQLTGTVLDSGTTFSFFPTNTARAFLQRVRSLMAQAAFSAVTVPGAAGACFETCDAAAYPRGLCCALQLRSDTAWSSQLLLRSCA